MEESSTPSKRWGTRVVSCYEKLRFIGEGTYGQVWEGRDRTTSRPVAIKKTRAHKPGMGIPRQALREIGLLNSCQHESMVEMIEVVTSAKIAAGGYESSLYIIFEYLPYDLSALIDANYKFTYEEVRCFLKQLVSVLSYLHSNGICHRDVKSSNLLIDRKHRLKLTDFGLARRLRREGDVPPKAHAFTNKVVTLWYRAPELLLGSHDYSYSIDMWSCGCIFVEMFIGQPLFQGRSEVDQMKRMFKLLGLPEVLDWPEVLNLPNDVPSVADPGSIKRLEKLLSEYDVPEEAVAFTKKLLVLNPDSRCSGVDALQSEFIQSSPDCSDLTQIALVETSLHEYETKQILKEGPLQLKPVDPGDVVKVLEKPVPNVDRKKKSKLEGGAAQGSMNGKDETLGADNSIGKTSRGGSSTHEPYPKARSAKEPYPAAQPSQSQKPAHLTVSRKEKFSHHKGNGQPGYRDKFSRRSGSPERSRGRRRSRSPRKRSHRSKRRRK